MQVQVYHYAIYRVLAFFFLLYQLVADFVILLVRRLETYYYQNYIPEDWDYIAENIKFATKIPSHLTILLNEEKPSFDDLSKLIVWSAASGIPFVSFYDRIGILRGKEEAFEEAIDKRMPEKVQVVWQKDINKGKNGYANRKVCVKLLSPKDGRDSLVDVVKDVVNDKVDDIDQKTVTEYMKSKFIFPDPDMGIYFDKFFCPYGYPPWQIISTEFLNLDTPHNLNVQQFVSLLYRYSKIEQRWGK